MLLIWRSSDKHVLHRSAKGFVEQVVNDEVPASARNQNDPGQVQVFHRHHEAARDVGPPVVPNEHFRQKAQSENDHHGDEHLRKSHFPAFVFALDAVQRFRLLVALHQNANGQNVDEPQQHEVGDEDESELYLVDVQQDHPQARRRPGERRGELRVLHRARRAVAEREGQREVPVDGGEDHDVERHHDRVQQDHVQRVLGNDRQLRDDDARHAVWRHGDVETDFPVDGARHELLLRLEQEALVEEVDLADGAEDAHDDVGDGDGALEDVLAVVEQLVLVDDGQQQAVAEESADSDEGVEKYLHDQLRFLAEVFVVVSLLSDKKRRSDYLVVWQSFTKNLSSRTPPGYLLTSCPGQL